MAIADGNCNCGAPKTILVSDLTQEQIAKIFTGEITNWSEVGGQDQAITVLGREASSGTRDGFEAIFGVRR
ncbi:MAG: substrate-binding domain-containing protein [Eubacteriales bacterium]